ncbi:APG_G0024640.mRNA.1.CDS.1 [Saccharomyces cerevisiae]|uniref:Nam8p n=1 Tax=Saccharomyces cerevisiae (strain JAY291) TaxID=574961 RepID=C7GWU9_YEAS2|nr:Nam8p [Saccharomyces cerevisiae YJM1250]AJV30580.1 Nam8p [Saccharomyces cerevisiae YJM1307]EEU04722.1 Nam8p [Saccharomyces cerevisiae JAY291]CAE6491349.1 Nam8p [Saccharomyces cerevisiae PE-2]CAI4509271.1 CNB_1a_G0024140.mRNA.1.CDS.1 [Saccharomyces cerevisiae]
MSYKQTTYYPSRGNLVRNDSSPYTNTISSETNNSSTSVLSLQGASNVSSGTTGNQLYMGDLDPTWDKNTVRQIWASLGEANINVRMMWNNTLNNGSRSSMGPKNNQGYCFVDFPSSTHAANALLKNGMLIPNFPNKKLKLNWATSSYSNSNNSLNNVKSGNNCSIFVGDLAPNVTESQLFELFINRYASTSHAKIVHDQVTGMSKGYGFVKFTNSDEQQLALSEMQGVFLNGRAIKVGPTSGQQQHVSGNNDYNRSSSSLNNENVDSRFLSKGQSFLSNGNNNMDFKRNDMSQFIYPVQQQPSLNHFTDPNNTTVFIGGLSSLVTEDELRAYFQPFGTIVYVKIPVGKGCGFVQYVDRLSAEAAIAGMQGFPIANSRVRLSWGRSAKQTALLQQAMLSNSLQVQQQQPGLQQPNYGYIPSSTCEAPVLPDNNVSSTMLPGCQILNYSNPYANANGLGSNNFSFYSNNNATNTQATSLLADTSSMDLSGTGGQQVIMQGSEAVVNSTNAMLNRLEQGSNGFMFA